MKMESMFNAADKNAEVPGAQLKTTKKKKQKQKQKQQCPAECVRVSVSPRPSALPNAADATKEDILRVEYWRALVERSFSASSGTSSKKTGTVLKSGVKPRERTP